MKKALIPMITGIALVLCTHPASAQMLGNMLKSAGQAAVQTAVQSLTPQARTAVDEAAKLKSGAPQENFLVARAKEFLAAGNYQPAWDLANYVLTTLNSGSIDAQKILADAKAALLKIAQEKAAQATQGLTATAAQGQQEAAAARQVQSDAAQTVNGIKGLFGTTK